jgi:hypothetical protein
MTATADKLSIERPSNSLFCLSNMFQILFAFAMNLIGEICMILALSGIFNQIVGYDIQGGREYNKNYFAQTESFNADIP